MHLAFYLTTVHKKRVLLIDSQPELGHACIHLGLDGTSFALEAPIWVRASALLTVK